ncbi:hypothetical protein O181_115573 [Austropuccinia psidii MF-1]|uniref:Uncharacterized protein n=1 Tax=Austropuccinia psidii MF-1 TaxID=1389203 RepID=A0A9Q3K6P9_9BASI|nr:hypothetical protein [Austropuccinia psidii MF-1]
MDAIFGKKSNIRGAYVIDTGKKGKSKEKDISNSEWDMEGDSDDGSDKDELTIGKEKTTRVVQVDQRDNSSKPEIVLVKSQDKLKKSGPKGGLPSKDKGVLGTL